MALNRALNPAQAGGKPTRNAAMPLFRLHAAKAHGNGAALT
jgi:hypothetical protein